MIVDILHTLYQRVSSHCSKPSLLQSFFNSYSQKSITLSIESSIWDHDQEVQEVINTSYSHHKYDNTHTKNNELKRATKIMKVMDLSRVRETQAIDLKLMELLKSKIHILLNIDDDLNPNKRNGKYCIPRNQLVGH